METTQMSFNRWMNKQNVRLYIDKIEYYSALKNEGNSDTCYTSESWKHMLREISQSLKVKYGVITLIWRL